jgi:hypothetical protein
MANTHLLIQTITVGTATATIDFTSIPQTYTDLKLLVSARVTQSAGLDLLIDFNGSTTGFTRKIIYSDDYSTISGYSDSSRSFGIVGGSSYTSNVFSINEIYIPNYTGSNNKVASGMSHTENNATAANFQITGHTWANTAAITRLTVNVSGTTFVQNTTASLYGIKNT